MDSAASERESKNRLIRLLARRRAKRDREFLEVLGDSAGAKDVHDADLAHEMSLGKNSGEAGRGIGLL